MFGLCKGCGGGVVGWEYWCWGLWATLRGSVILAEQSREVLVVLGAFGYTFTYGSWHRLDLG